MQAAPDVQAQRSSEADTSSASTSEYETESSQEAVVCASCKQSEPKYICPRCGTRSCSLACVKLHKGVAGCNGKRKRSDFVRISEFGEKQLLQDISLLEEVLRERASAERRQPDAATLRLPKQLHSLRLQAQKRAINLEFMMPGMQKRELNNSFYNHKGHRVFWHVELCFVSCGLSIHDRISEASLVGDLLCKHITTRRGFKDDEKLQPYAEGHKQLTVAMRTPYSKIGDDAKCYKFDLAKTLSSQLRGKTVIEFPTLLVLLPQELAAYQLVEENA